ncbi:hypothetical protein NHG25_04850 [Aerococcaceae bacterium NML191292]|nr:hypothetical protein [Aerococcaceae bacterium NML191292]MCW6675825.1 hypothetical protein [Aerococcaceae bacterium NML171108]MCW6677028.1 hypothetical protein [Aerococcaceae bacterium NML180378]
MKLLLIAYSVLLFVALRVDRKQNGNMYSKVTSAVIIALSILSVSHLLLDNPLVSWGISGLLVLLSIFLLKDRMQSGLKVNYLHHVLRLIFHGFLIMNIL